MRAPRRPRGSRKMSAKSLRNSFLKSLGPQDRRDFQHRLSDDDAEFLLADWYRYARDEQLAPDGDWKIWLFLGGRGAGKTRSGAEWIAHQVRAQGVTRVALIAVSHADARSVMIEGPAGLLNCSEGAEYEPSLRRVRWPAFGA